MGYFLFYCPANLGEAGVHDGFFLFFFLEKKEQENSRTSRAATPEIIGVTPFEKISNLQVECIVDLSKVFQLVKDRIPNCMVSPSKPNSAVCITTTGGSLGGFVTHL